MILILRLQFWSSQYFNLIVIIFKQNDMTQRWDSESYSHFWSEWIYKHALTDFTPRSPKTRNESTCYVPINGSYSSVKKLLVFDRNTWYHIPVWFDLVVFFDISSIVSYLMSNAVYGYIYKLYMIYKHIFLITFWMMLSSIFHTVKWFQVLQCNTNYSIQHYTFVAHNWIIPEILMYQIN